jgi:hypothetical protein
MNTSPYWSMLAFWIPTVTSLSCAMLVLFSRIDARKKEDHVQKKVFLCYFLTVFVSWVYLVLYFWHPQLCLHIKPVAYFCVAAYAIFFYQMVYLMTQTQEDKPFSWWHFAAPTLVAVVMVIWSQFVPSDIRLEIIRSKASHPDYPFFSFFYSSFLIIRIVFGFSYLTFATIRFRHFRRTQNIENKEKLRWVHLLFALLILKQVFILMFILMVLLIKRNFVYHPVFLLCMFIPVSYVYVVLTYNIIKGNYPPRQLKIPLYSNIPPPLH